ncbi:MAG: hypothetical protein JOZ07_10075 [Solirubrobacterales bacterium]|nr:hypothetical protein [Solirubrobacterales bacterium]
MWRAAVKRGLANAGRRVPDRVLYDLNGVLNYLEAGAFMRRRDLCPRRRGATKFEVFDLIGAEVADRDVLYLEFGVAAGTSMRHWSALLRDPRSALHGLDSFEGLPDDWILGRGAGHFSTRGRPPEIDDPRVRFFPGWFADTLATYRFEPHEQLVVNFDADLYSSTVTALAAVAPHAVPGTFLYFDEFNHRADEMRAFGEFLDRTGRRCELFAASGDLAHAAFRLL